MDPFADPSDDSTAPAGAAPGSVRLAHVSDTHLGYEAYRALSAAGNNQRGEDIVRAFVAACKAIIDADPPLVLHTGDVAERPHIPIRLMLLVRQWFTKLAGIRPDGSRRQLVVIAGNHELPSTRREACFLELYRDIPGVHVVTDDYRVVSFDDAGQPGGAAAELAVVLVHCLPHDSLKDLAAEGRFDDVVPHPGKVNILAAHGVAGGSGLFRRTMGREYHIPTDVLARRWDYGALGHWHRQGPVSLVSAGAAKGGSSGRVWYAGSTENCGFGDLLDNGASRGFLLVQTDPEELPAVERVAVPTRSMFRLPVLDGAGLTPEQITDELRARLKKAKAAGDLAGAVVGQIVKGVPREIWALVDVQSVRDTAQDALHYEITVEPVLRSTDDTAEVRAPGVGDLAHVLAERAEVVLARTEIDGALELARSLLGKYLAEPVGDDLPDGGGDTTEPATAGDAAAGTTACDPRDASGSEA